MIIIIIEVDEVIYDMAPIGDRGYVCACCDFLANNKDVDDLSECPIDPTICEKVIEQCCFQKRS